MNRPIVLLASVLLGLIPVLGACDQSPIGVRGSGDVSSESREVSGFEQIKLRGSGSVIVEVTGTESLTIEAEENLLEYLTTDVEGGVLELGTSRSISPTEEITYRITAIALDALTISGSGDITALGVSGERLDVEISGSGDLRLPDVQVREVSADLSGSGAIEISGATDELRVSISGSGDFEGSDLTADTGNVVVSGSGDAAVNVTERLEAAVSGSGTVRYYGNPTVDATTSGSGDIERAGG